MERQGFIFYSSFYEAISNLPAENQLELYNAIASYSFTFIEPELSGISKVVWVLIKPQLDANSKRFLDGCKGGRPKKETTGLDEKITTGFENEKPKEKEKKKIKEKDKEKILSTKVDNVQSTYGDQDINECLEIIKRFNGGIIDGTQKEQRIYGKNLIGKLKEIESVKNGNYTRSQVLETILQIVSQNTYHAQKIAGPKKIYYELGGLMQICKSEFAKKKQQEIPFIPGVG